MISDESAGRLHDRVSRGDTLSPDERADLDAWLAAQDEAEAALLSRQSAEALVAELRSQVKSALEQVGTITRTIQQLTAENDALRRDVDALRKQLAVRPVLRPA